MYYIINIEERRIVWDESNTSCETRWQTIGRVGDLLFFVYTENREDTRLAAERNRRKKKKSITIRIAPEILESYKTKGDGYTGIMADVLIYALNNPGILKEATR